MLANIAETVIFMFLGLSTIVDTLDWNLSFIFFALLFCIVYRVVGNDLCYFYLKHLRKLQIQIFISEFYNFTSLSLIFC